MDICHVTTAHPARDIRIFHKECASLAAAGHCVTLLVAGEGEDFMENGVCVHYIMVHYKSRPGRMLRAPFAMAAAVVKLRPQVVHFHDPEFLIATGGVQRKGIRVVYDVHEDLPRQILSKFYIPAWLRRPLAAVVEWYENRVARRLDAIITATPHIAERFRRYNPNTTDVRNYPLQEEFAPVEHSLKPTPPHLCYTGGISAIRGAGEMMEAIGALDVILDLAGPVDSCNYFQELRKFPGWKKKIYHGVVDRTAVSRLMSESAIGLNLMHPVPNYVDAIPTKLFEYMLAGIPVVISDFPSWKAIVDAHRCGIAVNPLDVAQIQEAIRTLIGNPALAGEMGARGREAALKYYSWETEKEKLLMVYRNFEPQGVA